MFLATISTEKGPRRKRDNSSKKEGTGIEKGKRISNLLLLPPSYASRKGECSPIITLFYPYRRREGKRLSRERVPHSCFYFIG